MDKIFSARRIFRQTMAMVDFIVGDYCIRVFIGEVPSIYEHYILHAEVVFDADLQNEGTAVYIVIYNNVEKDSKYTIIAFRSQPLGFAGFSPSIYFEPQTTILFIGGGSIIKTIDLRTKKIIYEKDQGYGFWTWAKYGDVIVYSEELAFGVFNTHGTHLWETPVEPPHSYKITGDKVMLKFDGKEEVRNLYSGELAH